MTLKKSILQDLQQSLNSIKGIDLRDEERISHAISIAKLIQTASLFYIPRKEKRQIMRISRMMDDEQGKALMTALTDQCFRPKSPRRVLDQVIYLINTLGLPKFLLPIDRLKWVAFKALKFVFQDLLIERLLNEIRKESSSVILPGETDTLNAFIKKRTSKNILVNLNRIGEAVLGEQEARSRLDLYLHDLENPLIDYISVKISSIYSQIHLPAWAQCKEEIKSRLRELYLKAMSFPDDKGLPKFVNLDMEEYRDLALTKQSFKEVLDEPPFLSMRAGIVLQSYLPDTFPILKELTEWSQQRIAKGGAPIKIRLVKGANLMMERVEASIMEWPQAPYTKKMEVDANFKRMLLYALQKDHLNAVHLGVGSHNLFDVALTLVLCQEQEIDQHVTLEMLEGMSPHTRRVLSQIFPSILLYCPTARKHEFQNAITYLIRRLDENTGEENFLRHALTLSLSPQSWSKQAQAFTSSYRQVGSTFIGKRRAQNRIQDSFQIPPLETFHNVANTDFSLEENRAWGMKIAQEWKIKELGKVPLSIGEKEIYDTDSEAIGIDPSYPTSPRYHIAMASPKLAEEALVHASQYAKEWGDDCQSKTRLQVLRNVAKLFSDRRGEFIGALMADGGKVIIEADSEVSEAIDFILYYTHTFHNLMLNTSSGISSTPKGPTLVTPPWNFPCAIPTGGIVSALVAGNPVLFKPAPEACYIGWLIAKCFWDAGVPKKALQFIPCSESSVGSSLIQDKRIRKVLLTGATETALKFYHLRANLDLDAETGGKNALIITDLSDRDLAIKDLLNSAFGHAGQKCSAASLGVLLKEVYDDKHFLKQLKDAAESLHVGEAYDLKTKIPPLIAPPRGKLLEGLSTLAPKEEWLLQPRPHSHNPHLWSPGIKINIQEGSESHHTEFFGPLLGLHRATNLKTAISFVNQTKYGLTSGLHSLDPREQSLWFSQIEAGNCYINREITGAIVERQPFGGWKQSSYGSGFKAGGPNTLLNLIDVKQESLPNKKGKLPKKLKAFIVAAEKILSKADFSIFKSSLESYAYAWEEKQKLHDPSLLLGQDNYLFYTPKTNFCLRLQDSMHLLDVLRSLSIMLLVLEEGVISISPNFKMPSRLKRVSQLNRFQIEQQDQKLFYDSVSKGTFSTVRLLSTPPIEMYESAKSYGTPLISSPVLAYGGIEILHYLKEKSLSINYHRYGNLGLREKEKRCPLCPSPTQDSTQIN